MQTGRSQVCYPVEAGNSNVRSPVGYPAVPGRSNVRSPVGYPMLQGNPIVRGTLQSIAPGLRRVTQKGR
jgi:hypothetical protein